MNLDLPPCHELLAAPTAATATVDALLAVPRGARCVGDGGAVRRRRAPRRGRAATPPCPAPPSVRAVRAVTALAWALGATVECCRRADEAVVPPLLAALPGGYPPLRGRLVATWNDVTARPLPAPSTAPPFAMYLQDALPEGVPEEHRSSTCVAVAALRRRSAPRRCRCGRQPAAACVGRRGPVGGGRPAGGGPPVRRPAAPLSDHALPGVPAAAAERGARRGGGAWSGRLGCWPPPPASPMPQALQLQAYLLESLQKLTLVDPPRVRAVDAIAGSLAAVEVALPPAGRRGRPLAPESMQCRAVLHEVFKVLAPATGVLAASPDGLALLVRWASASDTPFDARLSETAAAMALFVGIQTLSFGAERLPPTLRNAHTTWARVARSHPDDAAQVGTLLGVLAARGAAGLSAVTAALPWGATPFPPPALSISHQDAVYYGWGCGCPRRVDPPAPPRRRQPRPPHLRPVPRRDLLLPRVCGGRLAWGGRGAQGGVPPLGGLPVRPAAGAAVRSALLPALWGGAPGGGPDGSPAGHLFPVSGVAPAALVGPPRRWLLPAAVADRATGLGLAVADVIAVVDPPSWSYTLIPVAEYGHWPSAVPAATLERLGRHDGGRVLRVVVREHPPRVYGFGPDPDVEAFT